MEKEGKLKKSVLLQIDWLRQLDLPGKEKWESVKAYSISEFAKHRGCSEEDVIEVATSKHKMSRSWKEFIVLVSIAESCFYLGENYSATKLLEATFIDGDILSIVRIFQIL